MILQASGEEKILVSSHGYSDAAIFFVKGFPSKDDLFNGLALTGLSEKTLDSFLKPAGISIKQCYRSCFIKESLEYSGQNPKKLHDAIKKIDKEAYEKILLDEIKSVLPTVIVPLDDLALSIVYPHINAIKKPKGRRYWTYCYRGSILPLREDWQNEIGIENTVRVIPTLGPGLLYADWTARSYTQLDYRRIGVESLKRSKIEEFGLIWVAKNAKDLNAFFERSFKANPKRMTTDVETFGGMLTCASFCFDGYEAVSVPFWDPDISLGERALMWKLVARVLSTDLEKNNQNYKYDYNIYRRHGFNPRGTVSDTMLKGALLYPELPKGLDFYTSIYTTMHYYKDEGKNYDPKSYNRDKLYFYNAKDSLSAHICADEMDKELEEEGMLGLYYDEVAPTILIYADMDETGLLVEESVKEYLKNKYGKMFDTYQNVLRNVIGNDKFNARGNDVGRLLYEELGFPKKTKTDENGVTRYVCDKETLDDLLIHYGESTKSGKLGYQCISYIILLRKLAKILEYLNTPLAPDGTFRGVYNLSGTETGRTSCSKTIDSRIKYASDVKSSSITRYIGRSLQTITKHGFTIDEELFDDFGDDQIANDLRSMFVPRKGNIFIECDGSQAEARVVAVLAEDYELLAQFDAKPNIHKKTAALLFSVDANDIGKESPSVPKIGITYYHIGKITRHAGNNNMHAGRLTMMSHLPFKECDRILNVFHTNNPKIRNIFHKEVEEAIRFKGRTLVTPFKRKRTFFARLDDKLYNEGISYIQQSTISDLTKFTLHRVVKDLDGYMKKYKFVVEAHDGILSEVRKDSKNEYIDVFKKHYERKFSFKECSLSRDFELSIPCEVSTSEENWQNLREV